MKIHLSWLALLFWLVCSCKKASPIPTITFTSASLSCTMGVGSCFNDAVSSIPAGGVITYAVENTNIATINSISGVLLLKTEGTTTVTAIQAGVDGVNQQASASYSLTVLAPTATLAFATKDSLTCIVGNTACSNLATSSKPTGGDITYSIENTSIATINSTTGAVKALMAGTTTVTATQAAKTGLNQKATTTYKLIIIDPIAVLNFAANENYTCEVGRTTCANKATSNLPAGGAITYSVDKPSVATVNAITGDITPITAGTTIVTATQVPKAGINSLSYRTYILTIKPLSLTVTPASIRNGYAEKGYIMTVSTTLPWRATSDMPTWCKINDGAATGDGYFGITCLENTTTNSRTAVVTVTATGSNLQSSITLTQSPYPANPSITLFNGVTTGTNLSLGASRLTPSLFTITVTANVDWTVSNGNSSWCSSNATGSGNGTFQISTVPNTGITRTAVITVTSSRGTPQATITVTQP